MMKRILFVLTFSFASVSALSGADLGNERAAQGAREFRVKADRIAVDNVTKAATATGRVEAVMEPVHLRSDCATRDAEGVVTLKDPTELTTCTNRPGICHWALRGEVEYQDGKYIAGRNLWLEFYEIPIFWLPYFYYPLDGECALRIMPGYYDRWGAYVMMKYVYDIFGDPGSGEDSFWMYGNTRLDLRYENGIALGESLDWQLGAFGRGHFKIYYAWDEDYDHYDDHWDNPRHWHYKNWSSTVPYNRYMMELEHRWEVTERDTLRIAGVLASDSHIDSDFFRSSFLSIKNEWMARRGNELAWEHDENRFGAGLSVSGPLNSFHGGTARLPEAFLDVAPQPLFGLPINYESETRVGYLARRPAEYGDGEETNPYAYSPGLWARYATTRLDSYHRLTAPFKAADVLPIVPRLAYRGTFWNDCGNLDESGGWETAGKHNGAAFRSILEAGVTFAGRGQADLNDHWRHTIEPYLDVLAQKAWWAGVSGNKRPYIFDSLDASVDWEDQFAGRSRNLPYTYYGVTPGLRNAFDSRDDRGYLQRVFDVDFYVALQFNQTEWYGTDDNHKLANLGYSNYGKTDIYAAPGVRLRWFLDEDIALRSQFEYDPDYNTFAYGDLGLTHRVSDIFKWNVTYQLRDYRRWDFSSTPYDRDQMNGEDFNRATYQSVLVGFESQPLDWFALSPYLRWDCRDAELDAVGAWFDYLTDCLGFRLIVEYENSYTRIDGSERDDDFHVGFFIYLRALGASQSDLTRW